MTPTQAKRFFLKSTFLTLVLFAFACGGKPSNVVIRGTFEGMQNSKIFLREVADDRITSMDSTTIDSDGEFEFEAMVLGPNFLMLQVEKEVEPIMLLVEPNEEIVIKGQSGNLSKNYSVFGSKGSALVRELNFRLNKTVGIVDSLSKHFRASREHIKFDSIKRAIDTVYLKTIAEHKNFTVDFIKQNRHSLASIIALYQQYSKSNFVLNRRIDFELYRLVDSTLFPMYPANPLVANLHRNVATIAKQLNLFDKRNEMLEIGETIPNVMMPILGGEETRLLDLKNRYLLIDFWATWCNDCKLNNTKLRDIFVQYSPKGFGIVQFSLDFDQKILTDYYTEFEIPWKMAFDPLQWDSPILEQLSVNSIPSNYLIDRLGVIKARNISPQELQELLTKLLP